MSPSEDLELVRRVRESDGWALVQLEKRLGVAERWLAHINRQGDWALSRADLEDVKQDALLRVLTSLPNYRGEASLETWIRRICEVTLADARRKRAVRPRAEALGDHADSLSVHACQAQRADLRAALVRLSQDLPMEDMRVVRLHAVSGLSFERIAQRLGVSAGGVKARWYRALVLLRAHLDA
ncbi:MAG: sigma-70 family RNA polymerase sigma factor [Planctomycetes bacterium]|nr:sigma-70 family RNA polymerase sigma factor [Planctomycetota bacterium]